VGALADRIDLRAFAKVNYALEVRGLRDDGYHEISTILQSVSLADELEIERTGGGIELLLKPHGVEVGPLEENTVYLAWKLLREASGRELPVRVRLHKKIPPGAGLGGGSADAAAVLAGTNELFGLGLSHGDLRELGGSIGADVPFCLTGGTALGEGIGDVLSPLPAPPDHHLVLVKPSRSAGTRGIYRAYDEHPERGTATVEPVIWALRSGGLSALAEAVGNDLETVTIELVPEVGVYRQRMLEEGALGAAMTGSGTAVYGIFGAVEEAEIASERLEAPFAGLFGPVSRGVERL